jgi:hypothetical protein
MSATFGQADIQALIDAGYGYAADVLGASFAVYRPSGPLSPTDLTRQIATLLAKFDVSPTFAHRQPSNYKNPIYYLLADASMLLPGDYLVGAQGTWYVAGIEPNVPPLCIACNRTLTLTRTSDNDATHAGGARGYGGRITRPSAAEATAGLGETPLMTGWPASVLLGTKGESAPATGRLPTDTRSPWWSIKLPAVPGVTLGNTDRVTDDLGRAYTVSAAELTDLGWNLTAVEAIT